MAANSNGNGDKTVPDLLQLDATPLSLGIDTKVYFMNVVIPRNTPLPTKITKICKTALDNQSTIRIAVFQGERTKATDNYLLGEFKVPGIPLAPKGVEQVEVSFEIDANGTLKVRAKVLTTGTIEKITITNVNGRRSEKEINKMIEDAKTYEFEDQEYKRKVDAYNAFDDYIYVMKNKINDYKIRKKLNEASKWLIKNQIRCLMKNPIKDPASIDKVECKKKKLEKIIELFENKNHASEVFENKNHASSFRTTFGRFACLW